MEKLAMSTGQHSCTHSRKKAALLLLKIDNNKDDHGNGHSHDHAGHSHSHPPTPSIQAEKPTPAQMDKLLSTLKQFVRDWSSEVRSLFHYNFQSNKL